MVIYHKTYTNHDNREQITHQISFSLKPSTSFCHKTYTFDDDRPRPRRPYLNLSGIRKRNMQHFSFLIMLYMKGFRQERRSLDNHLVASCSFFSCSCQLPTALKISAREIRSPARVFPSCCISLLFEMVSDCQVRLVRQRGNFRWWCLTSRCSDQASANTHGEHFSLVDATAVPG
jgi:hypothetical protein